MATAVTTTTVRSLYAHVPYCHTICGYCDFYSEVLDKRQTGATTAALLAELEGWRREHRLSLETIFVGGGTPTTLPPEELRRLLSELHRCADPDADLEFTVEANPATVGPAVAEALAGSGVTRVSIGAQSFDPRELRVLERIHRVEQVGQTVAAVRRAGIRQVNLDLIFAVPGQTLEAWLRNLNAAISLEPDHLSCYGLTYESGTPLFGQLERGQVRRAENELEAEMYEATIDRLADAGFEHYEISNFARPGRRCRHNLVYWRNEPCLGIGPSAAGLVIAAEGGCGPEGCGPEGCGPGGGGPGGCGAALRYRNVPDTAAWAKAVQAGERPWAESETLDPPARARETMMLWLRLIEGVDRAAFAKRFGGDPVEMFADAVRQHVADGLLEVSDQRLRLTRRGLLVADTVMADFL